MTGEFVRGDLLLRLERYYDAVPRSAARTEAVGPLTLFVREGAGWPFYARPALGSEAEITAADVAAVRDRQRALGVPEAFEWVPEVTPSLHAAAAAAGLHVHVHPLLVLDHSEYAPAPVPELTEVRRVTADAPDLAAVLSVSALAFGSPGEARSVKGQGEARATRQDGVAERDLAALGQKADQLDALRERLGSGRTVMFAAYGPHGPLSVGSHQPVGGATEVVGVGTLPAFRRDGLAAAVTTALVAHALADRRNLIFLSADDAAVARVYERIGFRRAATAGIAEPAEG